MFVSNLAKKLKTAYLKKVLVSSIEITKIGQKWLVLVPLQTSVRVFTLVPCMVTFFLKQLDKFEFSLEHQIKLVLKVIFWFISSKNEYYLLSNIHLSLVLTLRKQL